MFEMLQNYAKEVFDPRGARFDDFKRRQETISPYEQLMAQEYLRQNPDADFTGIPGYEAVQQRFNELHRKQNPFAAQAGTDQQTAKPAKKNVSGQNQDTSFMAQEQPGGMTMGAKGFKMTLPSGSSSKDRIFQRIQEKKNAGFQLSSMEQTFEKKYLGISDSKKGPQTTQDRMRVRKLAISMAKSDFIKEVGEEGAEYNPSEEQISEYILDAALYLYPNMTVEDAKNYSTMIRGGDDITDLGDMDRLPQEAKDGIDAYRAGAGGKINLDITLPKNITKTSQALEFLTKNGLSEDEAREWLKVRMRK